MTDYHPPTGPEIAEHPWGSRADLVQRHRGKGGLLGDATADMLEADAECERQLAILTTAMMGAQEINDALRVQLDEAKRLIATAGPSVEWELAAQSFLADSVSPPVPTQGEEAREGLRLLDGLAKTSPMENRVAAGQFLGWASRHLRPILERAGGS